MSANGAAVAATYVAEVGSSEGLYLCRAVCSRCRPEWKGDTRRAHNTGPAGVLTAQDHARRDVLVHVDRFHNGRLMGR